MSKMAPGLLDGRGGRCSIIAESIGFYSVFKTLPSCIYNSGSVSEECFSTLTRATSSMHTLMTNCSRSHVKGRIHGEGILLNLNITIKEHVLIHVIIVINLINSI